MKDFKIPKYTEQVIPEVGNLFKSIVLIGLLIASFLVAKTGVNAIDTYLLYGNTSFHFVLKWTLAIALGLFNAILIMGIAMQGHEAAHRLLFKRRFWNDLWGGILMGLSFIPFYDFREFHLTHHCYTHQPDLDPEEIVNKNQPFFSILAIGGLVGIWNHYNNVVSNLLSQSPKQYEALKDIFFLSLAGVFYFFIVPMLGISLCYTIFPTLLFVPLIFSIRAISEHHALPPMPKKSNNQTDRLTVDSWVVLTHPLLAWLWSNVNYHQVHHRYQYLSHQYLPEIFEATQHEQPYLVVKGYLRTLMNLQDRPYYGNYEDLRPFLTTKSNSKSYEKSLTY